MNSRVVHTVVRNLEGACAAVCSWWGKNNCQKKQTSLDTQSARRRLSKQAFKQLCTASH